MPLCAPRRSKRPKAYDIRIDCWEHAYAARPKTPRVFAGSPESKISEHVYKALVEGFRVDGARYVILLEDDLRAASDFFSVFSVGVQLLENDETLWCVMRCGGRLTSRASAG